MTRGPGDARFTVLKETSIEIYADELLEGFPGARMLQLLRDPRDNYAALAAGIESYYSKLGSDRLEVMMSLLFRCDLGFAAAERHERERPDRFRSVRFEDLVASPRETLEATCEWLGISFEESLLTPTFFGASTTGNSFEGRVMRSISTENLGRWRDRIDAEEAMVLEHVLGDRMERLGYARTFPMAEAARAAARFYARANDRFFFRDPYDTDAPLPKAR